MKLLNLEKFIVTLTTVEKQQHGRSIPLAEEDVALPHGTQFMEEVGTLEGWM
jgi:hypothetical protein